MLMVQSYIHYHLVNSIIGMATLASVHGTTNQELLLIQQKQAMSGHVQFVTFLSHDSACVYKLCRTNQTLGD